jgi:polyisoprenoid-binding protein YceI
MKKIQLMLFYCLIFSVTAANAQYYIAQTGETSFFSETPMENISALNKNVGAVINSTTNEVAVKMNISQFKFQNKLMEEHFNENYMETTKFPTSVFKGKIQEKVDFSKDGTYDVTIKGVLTVHGVSKEKTLNGKLTVAKEQVSFAGNFDIKLVDYKIEIPTLVFAKIAESIAVKNNFLLTLKK